VISPDADHPYVAEAQGYGMVILATMAGADPEAKAAFDGMVAYMLAHPSVNDHDLLAAEQDARCRSVNGSDSATDGDLDVAYALLLADRQWGSAGVHDYRGLAIRHIDAIKASEINPRTRLTLLGDWSTPGDPTYYVTRSSDWLLDRFRAFAKATGDPDWEEIRAAHQRLIAGQQSRYAPGTGLLADFVVATGTAPRPAPGEVLEDAHDGAYYWNACRDPWRIGADAVITGDSASRAAARTMSAWIRRATGGDPGRIAAGYTLKGVPIDEGEEPAFFAPFAVAAMSDPGAQAWLDALWAKMTRTPVVPSDYYAATVQLQVMILVSGNAWTP
jgi:endo-1,4-beta-D-glucanase Y